MDGLKEIDGFNAFVRDWHPSYLTEVMLAGLNVPIRIGAATVLPGDVVLAKPEGVIFIPAHLAEKVVTTAELVMLRDRFGHQRLKEGTYSPGQIDTRWSDEIEKDFSQWLNDHQDELPVAREQIQEILKNRTW
jgi:regulator of RNase E activity RraA